MIFRALFFGLLESIRKAWNVAVILNLQTAPTFQKFGTKKDQNSWFLIQVQLFVWDFSFHSLAILGEVSNILQWCSLLTLWMVYLLKSLHPFILPHSSCSRYPAIFLWPYWVDVYSFMKISYFSVCILLCYLSCTGIWPGPQ